MLLKFNKPCYSTIYFLALEYMAQQGESGPLKPKHIREAMRRLKRAWMSHFLLYSQIHKEKTLAFAGNSCDYFQWCAKRIFNFVASFNKKANITPTTVTTSSQDT